MPDHLESTSSSSGSVQSVQSDFCTANPSTASLKRLDFLVTILSLAIFPVLISWVVLERHLFSHVAWSVALPAIAILVLLPFLSRYFRILRHVDATRAFHFARYLISSILISILLHSLRAQLKLWHRKYFALATIPLLFAIAVKSCTSGFMEIHAPAYTDRFAELTQLVDAAPLDARQVRKVTGVLQYLDRVPNLSLYHPDMAAIATALHALYKNPVPTNDRTLYVDRLSQAITILTSDALPITESPILESRLRLLLAARLSLVRGQLASSSLSGATEALEILIRQEPTARQRLLETTSPQLPPILTNRTADRLSACVADLEYSIACLSLLTITKSYGPSLDIPHLKSLGVNCESLILLENHTRHMLDSFQDAVSSTPESHLRAINNSLDLEIWCLYRMALDPQHQHKKDPSRTISISSNDTDILLHQGEDRLRKQLQSLKIDLPTKPNAIAFLTIAQAYSMLSHSDQQRYRFSTDDAIKAQALSQLRSDLHSLLTAVHAALALGWPMDRFLQSTDPAEKPWFQWMDLQSGDDPSSQLVRETYQYFKEASTYPW